MNSEIKWNHKATTNNGTIGKELFEEASKLHKSAWVESSDSGKALQYIIENTESIVVVAFASFFLGKLLMKMQNK